MDFPLLAICDDELGEVWLRKHFHPRGLRCPKCDASVKQARVFGRTGRSHVTRYRCRDCQMVYTVYTGPLFANKQLRPAHVILLLRGVCQGESTAKLSRELYLAYETVHHLRQQLQLNAMHLQPNTPLPDAITEAELAQATGTHAPSLYRLLRALASLAVFAEDEQGRFALTSLAALLQRDVPGSLRPEALFAGNAPQWHAWGELLHSVQTGESAFEHHFGMSVWEYRAQHSEANAIANDYFTMVSMGQADALVAACDFSGINTLMDVGGGQGGLIAAVLKANRSLHGILFDQPHVVAGARALLERAGVADRCEIVGGDFYGALPSGADAIMLKNILHDWNDEESKTLLRNCRNTLPDDGRLLVIDGVIPRGNDPHPRKILDLQMLAVAGGRERTEQEFQMLFAETGFTLTRVIPTAGGISIVEGKARM